MKFTGCCYCRLEAGIRLREKEMFMAEMEENPLFLLLFAVLEGGIQLLCGFCLILILIWEEEKSWDGLKGAAAGIGFITPFVLFCFF
jgi:hypothetical protein